MTVSVQSATAITKSSDSSVTGVAVAFTVVNNGSSTVSIRNTFDNFTLKFGNGDVAPHSYDQFVDSSGNDVSCLRSEGATVEPGQQANETICFEPTSDESGQSMTFDWAAVDPGHFSFPIGTLQ